MSPFIPTVKDRSPRTNGHTRILNGVKKPLAGFGTRAVHVGSDPTEETGAVIPPISLSTTYKQNGVGIHKVGSEN
jgi:cystathionine gamma-lyase